METRKDDLHELALKAIRSALWRYVELNLRKKAETLPASTLKDIKQLLEECSYEESRRILAECCDEEGSINPRLLSMTLQSYDRSIAWLEAIEEGKGAVRL